MGQPDDNELYCLTSTTNKLAHITNGSISQVTENTVGISILRLSLESLEFHHSLCAKNMKYILLLTTNILRLCIT